MICERNAKQYCCEDISNIENYDKAIAAGKSQRWDCHHKLEKFYCAAELKKIKRYYKVPANELIFLTHKDHMQQPHKGHDEMRKKISSKFKGKNHPLYGKKYTKAEKEKQLLSQPHRRAVIQLTLAGKFVAEFPSIQNASTNVKISRLSIRWCCNNNDKSVGGFMWRYKEDYESGTK